MRGESVLEFAHGGEKRKLDDIIEGELTPESADELFLQCGEILEELRRHDAKFDPPRTHYYDIAVLTLKGYRTTEIAEKLGYKNKKSVERAIKEIRVIWKCFSGGLANIRVSSEDTSFETSLASEPLIVGRQRRGEPDPIWDGLFDIDGETARRMIVTTDKRVSRKHCRIQVVDEIKVDVANVSHKSEILVDHQKLLAGESKTVTGDCRVQIPGISIAVHLI